MQPSIGRQAQVIAVVLAAALCAEADTIVDYTSGSFGSGLAAFCGQRLTTPAGDAYSLERFTWFAIDGSTARGAGTLWLLSQAYPGLPNDLTASTTGYLAQSGTYGASETGYYTFSSTPELSPSTNYWVYMSDAKVADLGYASGTPNEMYHTLEGSAAYSNFAGYSLNFRAEGSQAGVPEPGTLALFGVITVAGGLAARRRRKRKA